MTQPITAEDLATCQMRGPVVFGDGANGMSFQTSVCIEHPRLERTWRGENREEQGRTFLTVDGIEVADLQEAAARLNEPPDPNSPREKAEARIREIKAKRDLERARRGGGA